MNNLYDVIIMASIVEKEKAAARLKRFRERQKEAAKIRDQKLKDLELENLVLREKLKAMWGDENHDTDNNGSGNV